MTNAVTEGCVEEVTEDKLPGFAVVMTVSKGEKGLANISLLNKVAMI